MEHVCVKVALTHRVLLRRQVYRMPRNVKGIGRTGKKHKKPADGGSPVMPNQEGVTGPLFTPQLSTRTRALYSLCGGGNECPYTVLQSYERKQIFGGVPCGFLKFT